MAVFFAVAAFVIFGYWALTLAEKAEMVTVVAAAHDLQAPRVLLASDVEAIQIRRDSAPGTAMVDPKDVVGRTLVHPVSQRQIITINELAGVLDPELGGMMVPQGFQGLTLPASWLAGPLPKVKNGDTVTIVVSGPGKEGAGNTGIVSAQVPVLAVKAGSDGTLQHILLKMDIKDALTVLQTHANNLLLEVLVDGVKPD